MKVIRVIILVLCRIRVQTSTHHQQDTQKVKIADHRKFCRKELKMSVGKTLL